MTGPVADPLLRHLPRLVRFWDVEAPGSHHREIPGSMAFVDVSGFTELSERLARHGNVGAEEITRVIDDTFDQLLREAYAHGANLLTFGGDALLLLFEGPGHAPRAAASAHAMRARLQAMGPFNTRDGDVTLRMSVGVHTGRFDVFLVGRSHREFFVAGPDTTRTVEMEGAAEPGQVLLSPEAAAALPAAHRGRRSGPGILLRGEPTAETLPFTSAETPPIDLAQFVPVALRTTLSSEHGVEPEHRPATIAFIHIDGLDTLLDQRGPTIATTALDELVTAVQRAADDNGVTFLASDVAPDGAKVILATGVPQASGNDQERMLLALRQVLSQQRDLSVEVGVNSGHVFSGVVGSEQRRTYTVMGDVVNLAARLMAAAPPGDLYATEGVLAGSRTTFATTRLEPLHVKGKTDPIPALSVGDAIGSRGDDAQDTEGLPLVGREGELEALLEDWTQAAGGTPGVTGLIAPVGMGKSRVLQAFLDRAAPAKLVRAECRLYQSATPYFPFRSILRQALDIPESDEAAAVLADVVARRAPRQQPWLALLGEVLGVEIPASPEVAELDDQFRPARTREAVHAVLSSSLLDPTVVLVEDTHWMDDSSRELLAGLARSVADEPWLFLLTSRPVAQPDDPAALWARHVDLGPLSDDAATRLLVAASAAEPLLPSQLNVLVERGEGRPLFLLELLAALQQGDDAETLPGSVEQLIAARVDRLAPGDRSMLRRLAVLGTGFRLEHTASVLSSDEAVPTQRDRTLARLRQFVTVADDGWVEFRNSLIRDVAYEGLPYRTRTTLHADVGDSIRASADDHPESQAELLSVHYHRARHWDDSWVFSRIAGDTARSLFANQDAVTFYRRALEAWRHLDLAKRDRTRVALRLGEVLERAGQYDDVLDVLGRATRHIDDDLQRAEVVLLRARVKMRKGAFSSALRDTALALTRLDGDERDVLGLRAELLALRSNIRLNQQRPREALDAARAAVDHARSAGEQAALARASANLDWAYFALGEPDRATHSSEAVTIYESLGMLDRAGDVVNNMGGFAYYLGDWDAAVEHVAHSRELYARAGNDVLSAATGLNLGELLVSQGRTKEAEPILAESWRILEAAGDRQHATQAELQTARLHLRRGDTERAHDVLTSVRAHANDLGQLQYAYEAVLYLAECRVRQGRSDEALDMVARATAKAGEMASMFRAQRARVVARAMVELGRHDEAEVALATGLEAAEELGLRYEEALLRMARCDVAVATGREPDPDDRAVVDDLVTTLGVRDVNQAI